MCRTIVAVALSWVKMSSDSDASAGFATGHGRVIVFDRSTALPIATLEAPVPTLGDRFGSSIVVEGERAVITAPGDECGFGEVHVFQRDPQLGWTHEATLTPPPDALEGWHGFGNAVAMSGGRILVGTGGMRSATEFGHRSALFRLDGQTWSLELTLDGAAEQPTGSPVALDAGGAIVGEASIGLGQMRYWPIPRSPDLDGDGMTGPADLGLLLGAWGVAAGSSADLNGDGVVDQSDLALLIGGWS